MNLEWIAVAAGLPALALVWRVHESARNRSALSSVWTSFFFGIVLTIPALLLGAAVRAGFVDALSAPFDALGTAFFVASLPEESLKLVALIAYATAQPRFLGPREGLTHGLAVGLGFATAESILLAGSGSAETLLLRIVTTVPLHGMLGVMMGFRVGRAVLRKGREGRELVRAFALPFLLHGLYDASLLLAASEAPATAGDPSTAAYLLGSVAVAVMLSCGFAVRRLGRRLDREDAFDGNVHPHAVPTAAELAARAWTRIVAGGFTAAAGLWLLLGTLAFPPTHTDIPANVELALVLVQVLATGLVVIGHVLALRGLALRRA